MNSIHLPDSRKKQIQILELVPFSSSARFSSWLKFSEVQGDKALGLKPGGDKNQPKKQPIKQTNTTNQNPTPHDFNVFVDLSLLKWSELLGCFNKTDGVTLPQQKAINGHKPNVNPCGFRTIYMIFIRFRISSCLSSLFLSYSNIVFDFSLFCRFVYF